VCHPSPAKSMPPCGRSCRRCLDGGVIGRQPNVVVGAAVVLRDVRLELVISATSGLGTAFALL
jgi:hypothetical protein